MTQPTTRSLTRATKRKPGLRARERSTVSRESAERDLTPGMDARSRLTESYWELRYDHGQLRARVARLDPEAPVTPAGGALPQSGATQFVPLSSLKR